MHCVSKNNVCFCFSPQAKDKRSHPHRNNPEPTELCPCPPLQPVQLWLLPRWAYLSWGAPRSWLPTNFSSHSDSIILYSDEVYTASNHHSAVVHLTIHTKLLLESLSGCHIIVATLTTLCMTRKVFRNYIEPDTLLRMPKFPIFIFVSNLQYRLLNCFFLLLFCFVFQLWLLSRWFDGCSGPQQRGLHGVCGPGPNSKQLYKCIMGNINKEL